MGIHECRYDIEGFARELEVDLESIAGLFGEYFNEMKSEMSEMRNFLCSKDWNMLQRVVHNVKGVSANLNINDVFKEAEKLDLHLKSGENGDAGELVERIAELVSAAETEIKEFFLMKGFTI